jgi:DedD protein
MAFFKFRTGADTQASSAPAPETVEALRRRASYRLAGAAVLVLAGVIGFPLLLDNQPRPIAVDIPIEIPDRSKVKPLGEAPSPAQPATADSGAAPAPQKPVSEVAAAAKPATGAASSSVASGAVTDKTEAKKSDKVATKNASTGAVTTASPSTAADGKPGGAKAPDSKPADSKASDGKAAAAKGRFVVQVGAFADVQKAREARARLEKAGLKTYTQVVQVSEGRRIRVRIGPFESRAQADAAAEKIRKLDLPAAVLEL